jgi:hypothetical protein
VVYGGDDRFYNNLFVGVVGVENCGTASYNPNTASYDEYVEKVLDQGIGDLEMFKRVEQPVYIGANAYTHGAEGFDREKDAYAEPAFDPGIKIIEEGSAVYLEMNVQPEMLEVKTKIASTETLGTVRIVDTIFDDPNAKPIIFNLDFTGARRSDKPVVGPIEGLKAGLNRIKVWGE